MNEQWMDDGWTDGWAQGQLSKVHQEGQCPNYRSLTSADSGRREVEKILDLLASKMTHFQELTEITLSQWGRICAQNRYLVELQGEEIGLSRV